jgi:hypothetical protein
MKQSRSMSLAESVANVAIGFSINFTANLLVLPLFGFAVTPSDALGIGVIFTAIAIVRSFAVRRLFEGFR